MFEERTDMTRLDLRPILQRSRIDGHGIARILAAPRCVFQHGMLGKETTYLCIARLSDLWCVLAVAKHIRPTEKDWKTAERMANAFATMLSSLPSAAKIDPSLPPPPADWVDAMIRSIKAQAESEEKRRKPPRAHRPPREDKRIVLPMLLEVYAQAYGRSPSPAAEGPTYRFAHAFFSELGAALKHVETDPPDALRTLQDASRITSAASLQSDIRAATSRTAQRDVGRHMFEAMKRIAWRRPWLRKA